MTPEVEQLFTDKELSDYLYQRFFRCVTAHLSWLKVGEMYWFEHLANGEYCVRSDNNLGRQFEMTEHQLLTNFVPVECEENIVKAIEHGMFLKEKGLYNSDLDWIKEYYNKKKK